MALNATGSGVDDPDQQFYENYACGSARNYSGYCNKELDEKFDEQSEMADQEKRKKLVWEIDKKLQEDGARPIIFQHMRRDLHAAPGQGPDDDGQQHLQRLAHGRRLARQVAPPRGPRPPERGRGPAADQEPLAGGCSARGAPAPHSAVRAAIAVARRTVAHPMPVPVHHAVAIPIAIAGSCSRSHSHRRWRRRIGGDRPDGGGGR